MQLEIYEWENIWWEHTENETAKRALYIGDSISCGTRHFANQVAKGTWLFDGFGTSKALDNPYFKKSLLCFMEQQVRCDAVLFNNGLHGWHLSEEEYKTQYRQMLEYLITHTNAPIYIVSTTNDANDTDKNKRVIERNRIARKLADEFKFPYIDLYAISVANRGLHLEDGIHFTDQGYALLAENILKVIGEVN